MKFNEAKKCSLSHGENTAPLMFPWQIWHEREPNLNHQVSSIKHCSRKEQFHWRGTSSVFPACVKSVNFTRGLFTVCLFVCLGLFFGTKREGMQLQASIVHVTAFCPDIKGTFSVQMILTNQDVVITFLYTQHMVYISPSLFPATVHRPLRQFSPETLTLPLSDQLVSPATNLSFGESPWKIEVFI